MGKFTAREVEIRRRVEVALKRQDRNVSIFRAYHGIHPYSQSYSLALVGEIHDLTGARVRQIVMKMERDLRRQKLIRGGEVCPR